MRKIKMVDMRASNIDMQNLEELTKVLSGRGIDIVTKDGILNLVFKQIFTLSELTKKEEELNRILIQTMSDLKIKCTFSFGLVKTTANKETEIQICFQKNKFH